MDGGLFVFSLLATFFAAALTVPAGFGLATMITPVVFLWLEPHEAVAVVCLLYTSPSPRDATLSRMPSSA